MHVEILSNNTLYQHAVPNLLLASPGDSSGLLHSIIARVLHDSMQANIRHDADYGHQRLCVKANKHAYLKN